MVNHDLDFLCYLYQSFHNPEPFCFGELWTDSSLCFRWRSNFPCSNVSDPCTSVELLCSCFCRITAACHYDVSGQYSPVWKKNLWRPILLCLSDLQPVLKPSFFFLLGLSSSHPKTVVGFMVVINKNTQFGSRNELVFCVEPVMKQKRCQRYRLQMQDLWNRPFSSSPDMWLWWEESAQHMFMVSIKPLFPFHYTASQ